MVVRVGKHTLNIPIGWEFRWKDCNTELLPCRNRSVFDGIEATLSEVSLATLFCQNKLTSLFLKTFPKEAKWVMKSAASLGIIRGNQPFTP